MKKNLLTMIALCLAMTSQAQEETIVDAYFTIGEMPDMMKFLPAPPDSTSAAFLKGGLAGRAFYSDASFGFSIVEACASQ